MIWRIEVAEKDGFYDAVGASVKHDIRDLAGDIAVKEVKTVQVYLLDGDVDEYGVKRVCENLLIDPITQKYNYRGPVLDERRYKVVEVAYNAGVMDPVETSAKKAINDLGVLGVRIVKTAKKYCIKGDLSYAEIHRIAEKLLYNKV
ncbi:MAG: phosphoribosylformylglycinamidine synthase subunit PurS, partial [Candidatus Omnitrophica bacterium]|nr:phosphoribosylformylglycinamidine synthase subunit PurS [Candidatus Omnitrophota bacterium]